MACCGFSRSRKVGAVIEDGREETGETARILESDQQLGMSLQCFYKFLSEHPDVRDETLTTSGINRRHIKKETEGTHQAYIHKYVGQVDTEGKPLVSVATVFVSHAWKYSFVEDVLDVLEQYELKKPGTYFWFDLFTNNQNDTKDKDYNWFRQSFRRGVKDIGKVLLVMSPWNNPLPLTRAWCLFEISVALEMNEDQFVAMLPKSQINPLVKAVCEDSKCLIQVLADIQSSKAEATVLSDKDAIFQTIQNTEGGFHQIDKMIKDFLRNWYISNLIQSGDGADIDAQLLNNVAEVLIALSYLDEALQYLERSLTIRLNTLGDNHPNTATPYNNIGRVYNSKGEYAKALEYYQKSLNIRVNTLGDNHPDTAISQNNIGGVYYRTGEYDKALEYYKKSLNFRLNTLGDNHPDTATSYNNIGLVYKSKREYDKALEYYHKSLAIKLKTSGDNHPNTATSYNNIGRVHASKGEYGKALEYYHKSLAINLNTLGDNHPDTAASYNYIGTAYQSKGEYDKALEYYQKSLVIRLNTLGDNHPNTATTYTNIGAAYQSKGEYDMALQYYQKSLVS